MQSETAAASTHRSPSRSLRTGWKTTSLPFTPAPSFFYHLGDVVYFDGERNQYSPQFYDPYLHYPAPIFAIPGNHDGDLTVPPTGTSLEGFMVNFCSPTATVTPDAKDVSRPAMTQPNCYWTLTAPLVTIIGLYTNCPEHGVVEQDQADWFKSELAAADQGKALIVACTIPRTRRMRITAQAPDAPAPDGRFHRERPCPRPRADRACAQLPALQRPH